MINTANASLPEFGAEVAKSVSQSDVEDSGVDIDERYWWMTMKTMTMNLIINYYGNDDGDDDDDENDG